MFLLFLLNLYNYLNSPFIIVNCECYNDYKKFLNYIFIEKHSYMCCIKDKAQVLHKSFPVMLGSFIDLVIRDKCPTIDPKHFGALIIEGEFKIIPNFITNNVNNLVVYRVKKKQKFSKQTLIWHITSNDSVYVLKFESDIELTKIIKSEEDKERTVDFCKNHDIKINIFEDKSRETIQIISWLKWLNESNPFKYHATQNEYLSLFEAIHRNYPNIDDLSNKVLIPGPFILKRVKELTMDKKRLRPIYTSGNMYFVLSKKNNINETSKNTNMSIQKDYSNIYMSIEGQKQDKIVDFLSITKRPSLNQQTINSNALKFPSDGRHFICPLTCKEMKDAGESLTLAQYIIVSLSVDVDKIFNFFKNEHSAENSFHLTINGFLTGLKIKFNLSDVVRYKRKLIYVTFTKYKNFIYLSSIENIILKWSSKHQVFFSPTELKYFPDIFSNYGEIHEFSNFVMHLPRFYKYSLPSKTTVAINNVKGSCNNLKNEPSTIMFLASIGYNSAILHDYKENIDKVKRKRNDLNVNNKRLKLNDGGLHLKFNEIRQHSDCDYTKYAIVKTELETPLEFLNLHRDKKLPAPIFNLSNKYDNSSFDDKHENSNRLFKQIFNSTMKMTSHLIDCTKKFKSSLFQFNYDVISCKKKLAIIKINQTENNQQKYSDNLNCFHREQYFQLKLYCQFKLLGPTCEDGFVADIDLVKNGPKKLISVSLNIKVSYDYVLIDEKKSEKYKNCYIPINQLLENIIVFGVFSSLTNLRLAQNKHVIIDQYKIGSSYYYYICYPLEIELHKLTYNLKSKYNAATGIIFIHFDYLLLMGVGTKICNPYGQKGVISKVMDLTPHGGWDAFGNFVKPQIIMSPISILGRTASAQTRSMLTDEFRAFTKTGGLIARQEFTVHYIDPSNKLNKTQVKNDTMTNQNGFDCNQLSMTSLILSKQSAINNMEYNKRLSFLIELFKGRGIKINFDF